MAQFMYIGGDQPATIDFLQSATDTANLTTYTFANQNLGAESSKRYIAVAVAQRGADSLASVTIGGVAATIVAEGLIASTNSAAIAIAKVPTGATGDIVVTWNTGSLRMGMSVYRITDIEDPTPSDIKTSEATDPSVSLDIPENGILLAIAMVAGSSVTASWTGANSDYYGVIESAIVMTTGSLELPAGQTGRTVGVNWTGSRTSPRFVAVSWA